MFSTPRLKPDGWDQFGSAWDPSGPSSPAIQRAYHARNVHDDDDIISFGRFEISNDEHRRRRMRSTRGSQRIDRLLALVQNDQCPAPTR